MFPTFIHAWSGNFYKAIQIVFEVYTYIYKYKYLTYKLIACKAFYTVYVYILCIQGFIC